MCVCLCVCEEEGEEGDLGVQDYEAVKRLVKHGSGLSPDPQALLILLLPSVPLPREGPGNWNRPHACLL